MWVKASRLHFPNAPPIVSLPPKDYLSCCVYREIEEQLADALYKRCQAKLMADPDQANIESALADGLKALTLYSEDDDYFMAVSTCYMRLNRYDEAMKMLQSVLDRSPKNYKALYHHAFCQRASGEQKNAIEGLTKVSTSTIIVMIKGRLLCVLCVGRRWFMRHTLPAGGCYRYWRTAAPMAARLRRAN